MDELRVEVRDGVAWLTLNRPERRNALTPELIGALLAELDRVDADPAIRVAVLAGAAPAFCAGFDIERIAGAGGGAAGAESELVEALCGRLRRVRAATIAMVAGVASGTGCDLAVSCDVRFGSDEAGFAMPPAKLGLLYSWQGMARLVRTVGAPAAKEMLFTGDLVDAGRALRIGLVNRLFPADQLEPATEAFARTVAANAPLSVAASKLIVNLIEEGAGPTEAALAGIREAADAVWSSEDSREGPRAFVERRVPTFTGR